MSLPPERLSEFGATVHSAGSRSDHDLGRKASQIQRCVSRARWLENGVQGVAGSNPAVPTCTKGRAQQPAAVAGLFVFPLIRSAIRVEGFWNDGHKERVRRCHDAGCEVGRPGALDSARAVPGTIGGRVLRCEHARAAGGRGNGATTRGWREAARERSRAASFYDPRQIAARRAVSLYPLEPELYFRRCNPGGQRA